MIYVTLKDFFDIECPDVFTHHISSITRTGHPGLIENREDLRFGRSNRYFGYWSVQLWFAIYCAFTCLGVSAEHLEKGSGMLKDVYRFHICDDVRRILHILQVKLPGVVK